MENEAKSHVLGNTIQTLTGGRPYVFVIMPYDTGWSFYEHVRTVIADEVSLACIRADEVLASGHDLLAKIHLLIERADLVVAEVSTASPNVFYEVGYTVGIKKSVMLLIEGAGDVPTDLRGLEVIRYDGSQQGMAKFDIDFRQHLRLRTTSHVAQLKDMLAAESPLPAYVIASPRYPSGPHPRRVLGQPRDRRTFGDNLGIRGLITAFGSMVGENSEVELISASYCTGDIVERSASLYLIGSRKVNWVTGHMLELLQRGREPLWSIDPLPGEDGEDNWEAALYRTNGGDVQILPHKKRDTGGSEGVVPIEDYGIIVRGPHPSFPDRLITIMAGPHSLGTGAACIAATRSALIRRISELLPGSEGIVDKRGTFWVLVKGVASDEDELLDVDGVTVEEAGRYAD